MPFLMLVGACAALQPGYRNDRFIIHNRGDFSEQQVQRVSRELSRGLRALEQYIGPIPQNKFPVIVNLWSGSGVSHSSHGQGPIELYWVREVQAPIMHELTHVLAGYTASHGHWTQEGFASYMQDQYGEDAAFPTRKMAHALAKVIREENSQLPMLAVMRDRNRGRYFGTRTPWERWLAYTQSTSFCRYLIDTYGMDTFLRLYDKPLEAMDFPQLFGKGPEELVADWETYLGHLDVDIARAHQIFKNLHTRRLRSEPEPRPGRSAATLAMAFLGARPFAKVAALNGVSGET
ncbi:MAG: hypothetical protein HYZ81_08310 [Nitrospinae bacterium]|nr:hypothetical protein [Nitrospinota bacterium]